MPQPQFDPRTDVPVCLMVQHPKGRILSRSAVPVGRATQYATACNDEARLPALPTPGKPIDTTHAVKSLTTDTNCVTCPKCRSTEKFLTTYMEQHHGYTPDEMDLIEQGVELGEPPVQAE